jgi:endonuclease/exonuclease/phosphatase family metal-dependent hydrolase
MLFKVMSFNIRFGLADDGPNSWENRKRLTAEAILRPRPDLVGLQEALDFQLEFLASALRGYVIDGHHGDDDGVWRNCCALVYRPERWNLLETHTFWLSRTPEVSSKSWGSRWPRRCTTGKFEDRESGRVLWHFNTHLDFEEPAQVHGAAVILRKVKELTNEDAVVLTGDFNTVPGSAVWRLLTGKMEEDGVTGDFRDSWQELHGNQAAPTYHGFGRFPLSDRIDWILYRGPLRAVDASILMPQGEPYPSDHAPMMTTFEWV